MYLTTLPESISCHLSERHKSRVSRASLETASCPRLSNSLATMLLMANTRNLLTIVNITLHMLPLWRSLTRSHSRLATSVLRSPRMKTCRWLLTMKLSRCNIIIRARWMHIVLNCRHGSWTTRGHSRN